MRAEDVQKADGLYNFYARLQEEPKEYFSPFSAFDKIAFLDRDFQKKCRDVLMPLVTQELKRLGVELKDGN